MKYVSLLGLGLTLSVSAQVPETAPLPAPTPAAFPQPAQTVTALRTDADLETMLGPIALYPDALIALILPASTQPAEIVLAARFVEAKGTEEALAAQPWDDSVKALTHYPDVLRWLDQNLPWTQALGDSFSNQPIDTMNTVQRLRAKARANGTLVDNAQQRIVQESNSIIIVPTQPSVVYVPVYDPTIVYVSQPVYVGRPYIYYRRSYPTGPWLSYSFNWSSGNVRVISQPYGVWSRPGYRNPPNAPVHVWSPPPRRNYPPGQPNIPQPTVNRPYQPGWSRQPGNPPRQTPNANVPRPTWQVTNPAQPFTNAQPNAAAPQVTRPAGQQQRPGSPATTPNQPNTTRPAPQPAQPNQPQPSGQVNPNNPRNGPRNGQPGASLTPSTPVVVTQPTAQRPQTGVRVNNVPTQTAPQVAPQSAGQNRVQLPPRNTTYTERRQGRTNTSPATPPTP